LRNLIVTRELRCCRSRIAITDGPPMLKSENARPNGWVYVDIRGRDLGSYVSEARARVAKAITVPPGYSIAWSGQFEYLERATERLAVVVPFTLLIILLLLYLTFHSMRSALLIMVTLPLALVGGIWLIFLLGHYVSVATIIGFIALAGVAAEFGGDAHLPRTGGGAAACGGNRDHIRRTAQRNRGRCSVARASEGHDRGGDHRGASAAVLGRGHGL
jgi:hypothetical protein